jgi:RNA polymerase sigma-70 factor (ECF subfamily)
MDRQMLALERCIRQLPEKSATLVRERYFRQQGTEAIAELFNKSAGAVRVALMRVRESLRQCIEQRLSVGDA